MRINTEKKTDSYKSLEKIALMQFISEFPNLILTFIAALASNTIIVWVDTFNSLGETLHTFIVFTVAGKMSRENGDRYNFGMERLEVFVSFICDVIVCAGLLTVLVGAIYSIIYPQSPSVTLGVFLILKCSNITFDTIFLVKQLKVQKQHNSRINESEVKNCRRELINDLVVGVVTCICFFFRDQMWVCYLNPAVSIVMIVIFFVSYARRIRDSIEELSDVSLPIAKQDEIFDTVLEHKDIIDRIEEVNCRRLNRKVYIDICLQMKDDVTYAMQTEYLGIIENAIQKKLPQAKVRLVIGNSDEKELQH